MANLLFVTGRPIIWEIFPLVQLITIYNFVVELGSVEAAPEGAGKNPGTSCFIHNVLTNETQTKWNNAYAKCANVTGLKHGPNYPDIKTSLEDFVNSDDKCYNECLYNELDAATLDSKVKRDWGEIIFKGNLTAELTSQTNTAWNSCIEDCEKVMKAKGERENKCMLFALHSFCNMKKIRDIFEVAPFH